MTDIGWADDTLRYWLQPISSSCHWYTRLIGNAQRPQAAVTRRGPTSLAAAGRLSRPLSGTHSGLTRRGHHLPRTIVTCRGPGNEPRHYSPRPEFHKSLAATGRGAIRVIYGGPKSELLAAGRSSDHSPRPAVCRCGPPPRPAVTRRCPTSLTAARRLSHGHSPRLAVVSLAAARLTRRGPPSLAAARVTSRLAVIQARPAPVTRSGLPLLAAAARASQAWVTRRGAVRVARRGSNSLAAARVRVNRSGLPSSGRDVLYSIIFCYIAKI